MNQVRFAVFLGLLLGSGPLNAQLYLADKIDIDAALSAKPETVSLPVGVELISVQPPGPADALGDDGIQLEYLIWEGSFEGASLPPGWISNTSQNCQWAPTTVDANIGSYSVSPVGGGAGCAGVPGASYPNNMQSFLYYGPFDLSDPDLSSASFKGSLKRDLGLGDTVYAAYSADCNTGWQGYPFEGAGAWTAFDLPLDALLGDDSVCVAFIFLSDESAQANAGVLVDDVLITRSDDLSPGDLSVQSVSVPSGPFSSSEGIVIDLVVENVGTETTLPYNLDFYRSADSIVNESDVYIGTLPDRDALDSGEIGRAHV